MADFVMPALGADMDAGTLVEWKVKAGDRVARGQIVAVVDTQKGAIDVEVWQAGVVDALLVPVGTKVPVGTVLARIRDEGSGVGAAVPVPVTPGTPVRASPAARALARERGIDLLSVTGTGPHGVITRDDVERAGAPAPAPEKGNAMRQAIGAAMARSKREIPHYYLAHRVDLGATLTRLSALNASRSPEDRLLPAAAILHAVAHALADFPLLNGFFLEGSFRPGASVVLGVAVKLRGGGLVAPGIPGAERLSLGDTMKALLDLTARARSGQLRASELASATVTVTQLGDGGAEIVYGVITPPQVAVIGVGGIAERPWAVGGLIGIRPVVEVTLAADHRVSDGHDGSRFLAALAHRLEHPEEESP